LEKVGEFTTNIINALNLDIPTGTDIFLGDSNIKHMQTSHPNDFIRYGGDIADIILNPDYVGKNKKDNSVEFVKEYLVDNAFVKVAVRVSQGNTYYARSIYVLNPRRVVNFIRKGTLLKP